ncbi:MAG TPA: hypothetical protein VKC60_08150 [Opitutaceae bacterium]|nr:hypothetical protein [Opitutaceae bacterium]
MSPTSRPDMPERSGMRCHIWSALRLSARPERGLGTEPLCRAFLLEAITME